MAKCKVCGGPKPPISRIKGVCNSYECIQAAKAATPVENKVPKRIKRDVKKLKKSIDNFKVFGKYQWDRRKNRAGEVYCEETGTFLGYEYDPKLGHGMCISHILPKSTHPELYYHPLNCNVLSHKAHRQWEFGDRQSMSIYKTNIEIIAEIKRTPDKKVDGIRE